MQEKTYMLKELTCFALALVLTSTLPLVGFQKAKLSQKQVSQLVSIGTPDDIIAQEIGDRGLDFEPTGKMIEDLQGHKAGPRTLGALRELIRLGTLEIQAPAGSDVTVDGMPSGSINAQKVLVLRELAAGSHQIIVRKTDYQEGHYTVEIGNREYKRLPVRLAWAGGFLSVRAEPPGSAISIEGLGQFNGGISDIESPPGTYSIAVTHAGFMPVHQNITVTAGQHAVSEIRLKADPESLKSTLAAAETGLAAGNTAAAIKSANEVLSLDANNAQARSLIAAAYFREQDTSHFAASFGEAIRLGGSVPVTLLHVHNGFAKKYLHPFTLTTTANTIAFDPQLSSGPCNIQPFTSPVKKVQDIEVRNGNGTVLLRLKLIDPNTSKAVTLDFAAPGSRWNSPAVQIVLGPGGPPITSPANASQILESVSGVLLNAVRANAAVPDGRTQQALDTKKETAESTLSANTGPAIPQRIRVGGNVAASGLVHKVTPVYPPEARLSRTQGIVRFTAVIGKDGHVQSLQIVSGDPVLAESARTAVEQWIYKPTLLNGEPVEFVTQIDVQFSRP